MNASACNRASPPDIAVPIAIQGHALFYQFGPDTPFHLENGSYRTKLDALATQIPEVRADAIRVSQSVVSRSTAVVSQCDSICTRPHQGGAHPLQTGFRE